MVELFIFFLKQHLFFSVCHKLSSAIEFYSVNCVSMSLVKKIKLLLDSLLMLNTSVIISVLSEKGLACSFCFLEQYSLTFLELQLLLM